MQTRKVEENKHSRNTHKKTVHPKVTYVTTFGTYDCFCVQVQSTTCSRYDCLCVANEEHLLHVFDRLKHDG